MGAAGVAEELRCPFTDRLERDCIAFCCVWGEPEGVSMPSSAVTDALRDNGWMSRHELEVIAGDPDLNRAMAAALAADAETARSSYEAASRSSSEAAAALAQVALVHQVGSVEQVVAACNQLAERFSRSPDATVRMAALHALMVAALQPGTGIDALQRATGRADKDPELRVAAADAHLEMARWWQARRAREPGRTRDADALAVRAISHYDAIIRRQAEDTDAALQTLVQIALNEKTNLLVDLLAWDKAMTSSERAVTAQVPSDAPAILRAAIAESWLTRGRLLFEHDDTTEGTVHALGELRRLFGSDPSPQVKEIVRNARPLEQRARHTHRRSRYGWTFLGPHTEFRVGVPFLGQHEWVAWGWKAWGLAIASTIMLALVGLWSVSRRVLETANAVGDAREQALDTVSTMAFVAGASMLALVWLAVNTRRLLRREFVQWRSLGGGLVLALALAGLIFAGGRVTDLLD
jgi:hypothetical protein